MTNTSNRDAKHPSPEDMEALREALDELEEKDKRIFQLTEGQSLQELTAELERVTPARTALARLTAELEEKDKRILQLTEGQALQELTAELERVTQERDEALGIQGLREQGLEPSEYVTPVQKVIQERRRAVQAEAEVERLRGDRERLLFIAEHLFQMVPQSVWRDQGGDDMQGHYEGDYHAEKVLEELREFRAATPTQEAGEGKTWGPERMRHDPEPKP